ncbi:hypothetical protein MKY96_09040 [Paenibacillus sp. FSL R7-0302]|uniref:hypothetical protein n=1 Tax=Paenibacillus sp. FSL R7-0302 TaxID=2921681 RepID=UPI0030F87173
MDTERLIRMPSDPGYSRTGPGVGDADPQSRELFAEYGAFDLGGASRTTTMIITYDTSIPVQAINGIIVFPRKWALLEVKQK